MDKISPIAEYICKHSQGFGTTIPSSIFSENDRLYKHIYQFIEEATELAIKKGMDIAKKEIAEIIHKNIVFGCDGKIFYFEKKISEETKKQFSQI